MHLLKTGPLDASTAGWATGAGPAIYSVGYKKEEKTNLFEVGILHYERKLKNKYSPWSVLYDAHDVIFHALAFVAQMQDIFHIVTIT